ncbi:Endoplasmic reticulum mannosyl-oligosaccharide 1,2-alpha-mannosidase [Colletotrichum tanaceti]|uniref:alpha-1,2-Mannosidase n=1 Tax=Colletotrichum tanaceti TaxID=1306861 RepID=A0A4U6X4J3_9PEZI|nr:Endoplasmic reticulum mannosyl-oligosaccharide 1,2-alpha-mannosidase [Colletotrichum tanaceti]TKW50298.1 Endoplasmic reticulum mannosyl-oligosaccharide 1,2-alpha-mannosidase [Colletotrichum tanaceti]
MILPRRPPRLALVVALAFVTILLLYNPYWLSASPVKGPRAPDSPPPPPSVSVLFRPSSFNWSTARQFHPVSDPLTSLPTGQPRRLPRVQHDFSVASPHPEARKRQEAVRDVFKKGYDSYKRLAWTRDELAPVTGHGRDTFGGWAASLVDSLDTLWIMGFRTEFYAAAEVAARLDWANTTDSSANLFETTIRHLGGLLSAYDLSGEAALLEKARELGDMLYMAFDTPNRLPGFWLNFQDAKEGTQLAGTHDPSACPGSLSLEFTRLSQLTGDMKYFDAVDRIARFLERTQYRSKLPGMWPRMINFREERVDTDNGFTLGALADSMYEYLPKMYSLLGGLDKKYEKMYVGAMAIAEQHLLFRPMTEDNADILFAGDAYVRIDRVDHVAEGQHLACFVGGMLGLGGKLFAVENHVRLGDRVARGCAWAYDAMPSGVMPEIFNLIGCFSSTTTTTTTDGCPWDEKRWQAEGDKALHKGFKNTRDPKYILRPEAIESIFLLYRMTGRQDLQDIAWKMFQAVVKATGTELANSAIADVTVPPDKTRKTDSMEARCSH